MADQPHFPADPAPGDAARRFAGLLSRELRARREGGMDDSYLRLKYEPGLFSPRGELNHLAVAAYAARLEPLLDEILRRRSPRLLDAGSGCGSEAILAALLGAAVTGIDIVPLRTRYARSRIPFYEEAGRRKLALDFVTANVIDHLRGAAGYDIVWANESVSHIHPAERFFAAAHGGLREDGVLIIADANARNPVARWRAARIRGSRNWVVRRQFAQLDQEAHDEVADERLFTCRTLPAALRSAGFHLERIAMHGFLGSYFLPRAWQSSPGWARFMNGVQEQARRVPLLRGLGSSMTVVARKAAVR
jgi:SAM-dependent methyltransferase